MNKTVNINLAGIFFHIDEDAYQKLQRYLEAIKRSFTDSQGRSEIISDIEARIAELFNERVQNDKQVVSVKQVDEVIAIMGQPEDYLVDDEIFEDEPKRSTASKSSKKLYRDKDNSYIAGVAAGLGHYLGIDAVWVRLLWILLALGSGGTFIFIYILFWILVPEAVTTSEKLTMTGEPVNISNIEKKIKDGIDNVADTVKNVDYDKYGERIKNNSKSFFDTIGDVFMFFLKIFAKFFAIILIITGASALIALIVSLFSVGIADAIHLPGIDLVEIFNAENTPVWLASLLTFLAVGIPFFFAFYLGLRILIRNLKSIGNVAKFTLLGLWLMAIVGLVVIGIKQASDFAFDSSVTNKEQINIRANDTLKIKMMGNHNIEHYFERDHRSFRLVYDENDEKTIYSTDVRFIVRSTNDSVASVSVEKTSNGGSYKQAKERAEKINYNYQLVNGELQLDGFLSTNYKNKYRNQQVEVILYVPEGSILYADDNTYTYHRNSSYYNDILDNGMEEHYLKVIRDDVICLDCDDESTKVNININKGQKGLKITNESMTIKGDSLEININGEGIKAQDEDVNVKITDEDGIQITTDNE
jgi:phage shock protein PspC (stress-responsive transcriptional regulator)